MLAIYTCFSLQPPARCSGPARVRVHRPRVFVSCSVGMHSFRASFLKMFAQHRGLRVKRGYNTAADAPVAASNLVGQ